MLTLQSEKESLPAQDLSEAIYMYLYFHYSYETSNPGRLITLILYHVTCTHILLLLVMHDYWRIVISLFSAFSCFSVCEYMIAYANMGYHLTGYLEFSNKTLLAGVVMPEQLTNGYAGNSNHQPIKNGKQKAHSSWLEHLLLPICLLCFTG